MPPSPADEDPGEKLRREAHEAAKREKPPRPINMELIRTPTRPRPVPRPAPNGTAPAGAPLTPSTLPTLVTRAASDIREEKVDWLWPGRIPMGMVSIIDGDPGLGKSLITLALSAAVSTGRPILPGTHAVGPAGVLIFPAEDDPARIVLPRLRAAGANLERCHIVDGVKVNGVTRHVTFPDYLNEVQEGIERHNARLVIIDPIMAFLNGGVDSHKDQSIREVLRPLSDLAGETGAAVVMVRHLNKKAGEAALYRGGGSIAFSGVARSALVVGKLPDRPDTYALAATKSNLAPPSPALSYSISAPEGVPVILWGEELDLTADGLLPAAPPRPPRKQAEAADWLAQELAAGPVPAKELFARAETAGYPVRTLRRAAGAIGVVKEREGFQGGGRWRLPDHSGQSDGPGESGVGRNGETSGKHADSSIPANGTLPGLNGVAGMEEGVIE